jgi:Uma2 family endonuclease
VTSAAAATPPRLTWREFAAIDHGESMRGMELIDGVLEEGEVPTRKHGRLITRLIMVFGPWIEQHGGGELLSQDNRLRIAERRVRKPDLLLVMRGSSPIFDEDTLVSPPDLVVEVVTKTPRDEHRDRVAKLADYELVGARQYWIIDPELERLEIYALGSDGLYSDPHIYETTDRVDGAQHGFDGISFRVADLGREL